MTQSTFLKAFILSSFVSSVYAFGEDRDCPADPYADPANDMYVPRINYNSDNWPHCSCNPLRYVPNKVLNCLGAALFFIVAAALTFCTSMLISVFVTSY